MSYPVNPPGGYFVPRSWLHGKLTALGGGLHKAVYGGAAWFFWEPPNRITNDPSDWFVGPYRSERSAKRGLDRFIRDESEGPEIRTWLV